MKVSIIRTLVPIAIAGPSLILAARLDSSLDAALVEAIYQGKISTVTKLLAQGANANAKDAQGTPVLMDSAVYSTAECMKILLDRGADPNARNAAGATAIIWAAGDRDKVKLLLAHHADVNARSGPGRTALLAAASQDGAYDIVAALVKAGADPTVKDNLTGPPPVFSGGGGAIASIEAAKARDSRSLQLLLAAGLPVNAADANGNTALSEAILRGNRQNIAVLLGYGADVNKKIGLLGTTPLMFASIRNDAEIARMLLAKGARVNDCNNRGETALMWAAYTDTRQPAVVNALIEASADVNIRSKSGETAFTWAAQRGETEITRSLREAGAEAVKGTSAVTSEESGKSLREAVESSLAAVQASGPSFVKVSGCVSCHHQILPVIATSLAHKNGYRYDEQAAERNLKTILGFVKPVPEILFEGTDVLPDLPVTGGNFLIAFDAAGHAPDQVTDSLVHNIAGKQARDGSWIGWVPRPPLESGDIQATALGLRSLQLYGMPGRKQEFQSRIDLARKWLLHASPRTTEEQRMRLLGLAWSGAEHSEIRHAAKTLLDAQRPDGGWAQLPTLSTDAYATGSVLAALYQAGQLTASEPEYRHGAEYLLRTQQADGTWVVKTRAYPFQPLIDSGFAHGRDQWTSIAATTWASIALMHAAEVPDLRATSGVRNTAVTKWSFYGDPDVYVAARRH